MQSKSAAQKETAMPQYNQHLPYNMMVERFRKIVIILLGIRIVLACTFFGFKTYHLAEYTSYTAFIRETSITASLIIGLIVASMSIIFFILFMIFVVRYDAFAIHACTWLTLFDLAFATLTLIFTMYIPITMVIVTHSLRTITVLTLSALSLLTTIFIMIFGFQLFNAIKLQEGYQRI